MVELKAEDIRKLRENKRGFNQTFDLIINVSNLDLKKPENRIRDRIKLPHKIKDRKICFIVDSLVTKAKETGRKVLTKNELDFDKRTGKKLANEYDFFVVEATIMPLTAKTLGKYVGPRNKPLIPLPPVTKNLSGIIEDLEKTISVNMVKNPVIQVPIGTEKLKDEEIIENFNVAYDKLKESIEGKGGLIKSVYLKLTMSKPIKLM
ncbi:MAG: 50S ribosomal protein L1 [Candidatus Aenigmarchaeota archaeon]|nr:50S ribosomal protein L1 [Candidatus Aenigmarchaeota archaeon]